jgi:Voltage-dependent anion channel
MGGSVQRGHGTGVVSIASHNAGFAVLSTVLLWTAVCAFVSLAVLDARLVRHPMALFRRAAQPGQGFHALGFVAAGCVLGARIAGPGTAALTIAATLLACGCVLWALILGAVAIVHGRGGANKPGGEWLLTVVATEGLAILAARIARLEHSRRCAPVQPRCGSRVVSPTSSSAPCSCAARPPRVRRRQRHTRLVDRHGRAGDLVRGRGQRHRRSLGNDGCRARRGGWGFASLMLIVITGADALRVRRLGLRFAPERWTMVFPLGMYCVASWSPWGGACTPAG